MSDPFMLEINPRVWLPEQAWARERADLSLIPDEQIQEWANLGVDWIWMMGVWDPSPRSREICLASPALFGGLGNFFPQAFPDHVVGSPFAVRNYALNPALGGHDTLQSLRERLHHHGIRLMLDFVPNHTATDHPWTKTHPEFYFQGTEPDLTERPNDYFRTPNGRILAHGRDPYFPSWTDTAQLNYFNAATREAMQEQLLEISRTCDGVRCDMAMLVTNEVFERSWGKNEKNRRFTPMHADERSKVSIHPSHSHTPFPSHRSHSSEFWESAIEAVHCENADFIFMAEVYWDMEWKLQQMGFDYTYDKRLYDRLIAGDGPGVRAHLQGASVEFLSRCVHFVENHDERRAQEAFGFRHRSAALVSAMVPGLRLHHEGQWEGRRTKISVQIGARPSEPADEKLREWYRRLLAELRREPWRSGNFRCLDINETDAENSNAGKIIAIRREAGRDCGLVIANIGGEDARGIIEYIPHDLDGETVFFREALSKHVVQHPLMELREKGLEIALKAGECFLFHVKNS